MLRRRLDTLPDPKLSRSINLMSIFSFPEAEQRPQEISPSSWKVITKAIEFTHQVEIRYLDELITQYVAAIVRAEGCKCGQCIKRARILTEKLDEELIRQTEFMTSEIEYEDKILAEQAISIAMQRMHEKRMKSWDKRAKKLRKLIDAYLQGKDNHLGDPLTPTQRAEVQRLLAEARQRAEENKRRRGKK